MLATHLRAKVEMGRHRHLQDRPVLIVRCDPSSGRTVVVDRFPAAGRVREGMTVEEAMSHHAGAVVIDADEPCYRSEFRRMVASLRTVSSQVEAADLGTAYARVDGLDQMYGGEMGAVSALVSALPTALGSRVGVASAKFPAYVAARTRRDPGASAVGSDAASFLAPHNIDLLPIPTAVKGDLRRFGLHTMGAVANMSSHALADRFGPDGQRAWSLCNGADESPLEPQTPEEPVIERISMPPHSCSVETLLVAVDALLRRAFARPDAKGRNVGVAHLLCESPGWVSWEQTAHFKQPVCTWESASRIIRYRVQVDPPALPVEDVTLTLTGIAGQPSVQLALLADPLRDRLQRLVEADRRLRPLMGGCTLYRIEAVASWHPVPEMRYLQVPIDPAARHAIKPLLTPTPVDVRENAAGEPLALRTLRAGRKWKKVARVDDRWTIDLWWLPQPVARSYFRIDPGDGKLITLYRDRSDCRWYRQGA